MPFPLIPIDYTNKDYESLRIALLDLARYRLPEWTDRSPADLGMLLVDLFAYMGDIVLYYQDRIAAESFLHTAQERRNVLNLLRLIGYELYPPIAAHADLQLFFNPPGPGESSVVVIPHGAQFATKGNGQAAQSFAYLGPTLEIDVASSQIAAAPDGRLVYEGLPVRHGRAVTDEILGSSTGEPNQFFQLAHQPVIPDSITLQVNEGSNWLEWKQQENFLYYTEPSGQVTVSNAESRNYYIQTDAEDYTYVFFGDGIYSRIPPVGTNNIRASYHVGGGEIGNVPAGSISEARTPIALLDGVTNPRPAAGGSNAETTEHAVRFGPLAFRSGQRAVTLHDFVALAHQAGGVAKVRALTRSWDRIDLYIAPEGDQARPVPESLKRRLIAYFEHKRMLGIIVTIQDPIYVPIDITVEVIASHQYNPEIVRQSVETGITNLLAFKTVDFGEPLYLSKVYEAIEALPGVYAATVIRFTRFDSDLNAFEADLAVLMALGITNIPESVRRAVRSGLNAEGRIDIGPFEIPMLGELIIEMRELVTA